MSCHNKALVDKCLYNIKRLGEIFRFFDCRHITAYFPESLRKRRATETLRIKTEVNMINRTVLIIHQHRTNHFTDILHFATTGDDDRSRGNDLFAIRIFLCHGQRVLACWHIDVQGTTEVRQGLHSTVEACILSFLATAGPHPIGTEAYTAEPFCQWSPNDVGQRLCNRQH